MKKISKLALKSQKKFTDKLTHLQIIWVRIRNFFGYEKDTNLIPENTIYCYTIDSDRMKNEPITSGYWIKTCPYYKTVGEKSACTYVGYYGYDVLLNDQCKICGKNYPKDED